MDSGKVLRITMTNFRCHVNSTFDIPDEGMVRIAGYSGSGKSTTFLAIIYALYGKYPSKVKKVTHGKTTCKVVLEYKDMIITRTKPALVTVQVEGDETTYEGDAAQNIIEKKLGMNYDEFYVGAFIHGRKSGSSVISMSSADQLNFINILSRESARTAAVMKDKIKARKKEIETEITKVKAEISILEKQHEEYVSNIVEIEAPSELSKGTDPAVIKQKSEAARSSLEKIEREMKVISSGIEEERKARESRIAIEKKIETLEVEIKQLSRILIGLKNVPSTDQVEALDAEIQSYKDDIAHYEEYIRYMNDKESLDKAIRAINEEKERKLEEIGNMVTSDEYIEELKIRVKDAEEQTTIFNQNMKTYEDELAKKQEAKQEITSLFYKIKSMIIDKNLNDIKSPKAMIAALNAIIDDKTKKYETLIVKKSPKYNCPHCDSVVAVFQNRLVEYKDTDTKVSEKAETIKSTIDILRTYVNQLEEAAKYFNVKPVKPEKTGEDYKELYDEYISARNINDTYKKLKHEKMPAGIEKMQRNVQKLQEKFEDEGDVNTIKAYIAEMKGMLAQAISNRQSGVKMIEEYNEHTASIKSKKETLKNLTSKIKEMKSDADLNEMEKKLQSHTSKVIQLNKLITKYREIVDEFAAYQEYMYNLEEEKKMQEIIQASKDKEEALLGELEGVQGVESTAKEAEILILEDVVNTINANAKMYLDSFFTTPISVRLVCAKEKKDGYKIQLNTVIEYQGSVYDNVEELCDGERQRCELAFLFAINDIVGSKILIMDECMNSTDPKMNMDILNLIHDMCGDKLILMISHEAVRGIFDHEVVIERSA